MNRTPALLANVLLMFVLPAFSILRAEDPEPVAVDWKQDVKQLRENISEQYQKSLELEEELSELEATSTENLPLQDKRRVQARIELIQEKLELISLLMGSLAFELSDLKEQVWKQGPKLQIDWLQTEIRDSEQELASLKVQQTEIEKRLESAELSEQEANRLKQRKTRLTSYRQSLEKSLTTARNALQNRTEKP